MQDFEPSLMPPDATDAPSHRFAFFGTQVLQAQPGAPTLSNATADTALYLGTWRGQPCWALRYVEVPQGYTPVSLRAAMMRLPEDEASLYGRAAQLLEWDRTHRYCGVCGTPTEPLTTERARRCPVCGHLAYPRLSPAMMALVIRGDQLLLARSPHFAPGMYSALAGFVEPGESLEACVRREIAEEVGVTVGALRYFGSQSWPFPHSLMLAFTAAWQAGEIVPQPGEIEDARWFAMDALPTIPPEFSLAGRLIRAAVSGWRASGQAWR
jgi:NAD+ diphosphatase